MTEPVTRAERVYLDVPYPIGSIVVVNDERRLYYIEAAGVAVRYPVAVGKPHELWLGRTFVSGKKVDPEWVAVDSDDYFEGGDPKNPLGKRALYLDWSLLRIHGTPSRGSIGSATSNGCVRMLNEDVVDLFDRVHIGAPVFAIRSFQDPETFLSSKPGEKIYNDPVARRLFKEREDAADDGRERGSGRVASISGRTSRN